MPIEILMPALSPTMEEGTLTNWMVKEGDMVSSGDLLAEIETDKATMEIEAVEEGEVAKILVPSGTAGVKVNTPIAILLEDGEDKSAMDNYTPGAGSTPAPDAQPPAPAEEAKAAEPATDTAKQAASTGGERIKASPLAKRLAAEKGLDLANLSGSGPNGRIVKADVENAQPQATKAKSEPAPQATAPSSGSTDVGMPLGGGAEYLERLGIAPGTYDLTPLDGMRRTIAKRLTDSFRDVPHFPLNIDIEIDAMLAMRKQLNSEAPDGVKISVNDMLIRACALALKQEPEANASYTPDGIAYHHHADVAVAVAIDGGLITPIVRHAENKGLSVISSEMKDLAGRARDRKLKPHEFQGGTFSISNLGMFGIKSFGSIINQPQGMILSVGAGEPRVVIKDDEFVKATVMSVTLSCDHRVVDGAVGARWLGVFKRLIERPVTMML